MAFDEEKHIQALVNMYRQGFINILNTLLQKERKGNVTVFYKDQLKNILDILAQLDVESAKWIQQVIPQIYQENYTQVLAFINKMGMQRKIKPNFAQVHQRAIDVIAQNMYNNLRQATQYAGRRIQDEFRQAGIDVMGEKYTEGLTWRETAKRLQDRLLTQGLTGFKDKLGREWRLDSYAQMVARTTSREIATVATLNTCQEADIDLIQISSHYPTCEICAPLQGKVFSISGKDDRYPKLEEEYTPPIHPNCYDKETEVYTEHGWKQFKDVKVGEKCLSINPDTLEMEYVKAINTINYKADTMIHFHHKHFDMMVTLDHLCLWQNDESRKRNGLLGGWRFVEAKELLNNASGRFLRTAKWKGKKLDNIRIGKIEFTAEQYAKFMGWYLSEGSCDNALKRISIAQSKEVNPDKWEEIKELIDEIDCKYSYNDNRFIMYNGFYEYFKQFGGSHEKHIPDNIKNATPKIIKLFLEAFIKGDGHERKSKCYKGGNFQNERVYTTSSKRMADDIGELLLKIGKRPSFYFSNNKGKKIKFRNGTYELNADIWRINECNSKTAALSNMKKEIVIYNDMVYCVELEKYHTLYVRRNGKCTWSGNCRHVTTPYVREFDPEAEKTQRHSNTPLDKDNRTEAEKQAYKEEMDKVTIARNRKRAREILYSKAPTAEKELAASKLKRTYEKAGTKPVGRDGAIIKEYLKEDKT